MTPPLFVGLCQPIPIHMRGVTFCGRSPIAVRALHLRLCNRSVADGMRDASSQTIGSAGYAGGRIVAVASRASRGSWRSADAKRKGPDERGHL